MFDRAAATYDRTGPRFFAAFGRRLVARARLDPGAAVLDVAVGRGAVLFPAAERVGPGGQVVGIDMAPDMVRKTAAEVRSGDWPQVAVREMDAEHLDFADASFDWVLCGFALWFFPQPGRALGEFFRVLRPGGRVGLSTWAEDCPYLAWLNRELSASLPLRDPAAPDRPEPPRFDTPGRLEAAMRQAGFTGIEIQGEEADFVYAQDEEWWASHWSHGIRARLERLEPLQLEAVKTEMLVKAGALRQPDGIHTLFRALFALGTRPLD